MIKVQTYKFVFVPKCSLDQSFWFGGRQIFLANGSWGAYWGYKYFELKYYPYNTTPPHKCPPPHIWTFFEPLSLLSLHAFLPCFPWFQSKTGVLAFKKNTRISGFFETPKKRHLLLLLSIILAHHGQNPAFFGKSSMFPLQKTWLIRVFFFQTSQPFLFVGPHLHLMVVGHEQRNHNQSCKKRYVSFGLTDRLGTDFWTPLHLYLHLHLRQPSSFFPQCPACHKGKANFGFFWLLGIPLKRGEIKWSQGLVGAKTYFAKKNNLFSNKK